MSSAALYFAAARAADDILADVYKVDVRKALDPLKTKDFEKIVAGLGHSLAKKVVPVEDAALKKAIEKLDVDWKNLGAEARSKVVQEAQKYLGAPYVAKVLPAIDQELAFFTSDFVPAVKKNTVHKFDLSISPNLSATDERIAQFARASQGHFVRDELGQRHDAFGAQARDIVAAGLAKGLGSKDISEKLARDLAAAKRSDGYWTMIAMVFANRARTSVQLFSFGEAGIDYYTWESVLDEATSMQCRFMHGRRFGVAGAIKNIRGVEEADDPEAVKTITPFMSLSGDRLYYKDSGGNHVDVANVTENAVGQKDKIGSFAAGAMSTAKLEGIGMHMPPIHGHCRSTVIPDVAPLAPGKPVPPAPVPGAPVPQPKKPHGESAEAKQAALEALDKVSSGGMTDLSGAGGVFPKDGLAMPPYTHLGPPDFLDAHFASVKASKKPKLDELVATSLTADEQKIADLIKSPKKLDAAEKPIVVKYNGALYVHKGHEVLAAQKLLGQKIAYADVVDLDKHPPPAPPAAPPPPPAPAHPLGIHDPKKSVVWGKTPEHEGVSLNGVKLEAAPLQDSKFWKKVPDVDVHEPPPPPLKPGQKRSSGVVIVEDDGRVWIVEPKDHFGGYEHTWPKGKTEPDLTHQQNALKEAHEEAGLLAEITGYLGDFEGTTSNTRYYVGRRVGGGPWAAHWESQTVKLVPPEEAEKLFNTERDKKVLAALKAQQNAPPAPPVIAPKPPAPPPPPPHPAPAMAPAAPPSKADVVLGTKVGSAQGSNDGGFYVGKDGVKRYVKFYADASQAPGEHLANTLYKDLGHGAAESSVFEHNGKTAYASVVLDGFETLASKGLTKARAEEVMKGFAVDVLTGNWDAVGTGFDNVGFDASGKLLRIDNGGTFLMRAKHGRKPEGILNAISEWEGMFDPSVNPYYSKVAKAAGYEKAEDLKAILLPQIDAIAKLRDAHGGWAGYVEKHSPMLPPADKAKIVKMLDSRAKLLEAKAVELRKPAPAAPPRPRAGVQVTAKYGEVQKAPPRDDTNMAIGKFEDLPKRKLPEIDLKVPPTGEQDSDYVKRARKTMDALERKDDEAHRAIKSFAGSSYGAIRKAQTTGDTTSVAGKQAIAIERAFARGEGAVPGQVFRGIQNLPRAVIDQFMVQDEIDMKGIASSTRHADVAINRFMGGIHGSDLRAFFVIHQKTGIPIETVSSYASELEILTSGKKRYRVLNRHRAEENEKAILIMEIEEM